MKYLVSIVVTIILSLFKAFVVMKLYNWYPSQIFGVTTITLMQSFVLIFTVNVLRSKRTFDDADDLPLNKIIFHSTVYGVALLIYLFIGWVLLPYV
ncbi:hypothetical protein [Cytobacillus purgationiresistens]|uniref:ABC-type iron transport system FetAB permease component n=1 Tax=Cytobacillus purgationiresistens TaxID=863449 RepID=A0ABU0AHN3_9BACI|nr:hypothetical protein [Cytobacillus purgationiresistens]MDQ0270763.1 ABC-type iron transport system FetAB permease component [Cytobacillus purgationiresistens]